MRLDLGWAREFAGVFGCRSGRVTAGFVGSTGFAWTAGTVVVGVVGIGVGRGRAKVDDACFFHGVYLSTELLVDAVEGGEEGGLDLGEAGCCVFLVLCLLFLLFGFGLVLGVG